jgi:hypothetical protein
MLKIRIELVRYGIIKTRDFWCVDLWNDGTGNLSLGNYCFNIFRKNSTRSVWKSGEIKNFQRKKKNVWYLLYLCLKQVFEDEDLKNKQRKGQTL